MRIWLAGASVVMCFFLPSFGEADSTGPLSVAGCVSDDGTGGGCIDGNGLSGAGWVAVSPDGKYAYVVSFNSSAVTTFARNTAMGVLTQLSGTAGCMAENADGITCARGRGLNGAVSLVVSPDGKHVYVASRGDAIAAFSRNTTSGELTQLSGTAGCIAENGDGVACAAGKALMGPRTITMGPEGNDVYVGSRDSNAVAVFSRNTITGALTQLSGTAGCVSEYGTGGICADGKGLLGARGVVVSPDGQHLYLASENSNAVAVFSRNTITGTLTQLSGAAGCIAENGDGVTCAGGRGLVTPIHVDVSPDGNHVYVASRDSDSVAVFSRNALTGALTRLNGAAGCIAENGDWITCADGRGLGGAVYLNVSPDGKNVYVASQLSSSVTVFSRDTTSGELTQLSGTAGCVAENGDGITCADGWGLNGTLALTVSPDGQNVYVASYISGAVTVFSRSKIDQLYVNRRVKKFLEGGTCKTECVSVQTSR